MTISPFIIEAFQYCGTILWEVSKPFIAFIFGFYLPYMIGSTIGYFTMGYSTIGWKLVTEKYD